MIFLLFINTVTSAQWAVLMAGSKGYNNYRHQSDVFNFYKILRSRNFDKNHIITLAYNDVVNDRLNPFKGQIFNNASHINVYPGEEAIDYKEREANANNFLRVLIGDSSHGRALQTNENDDIFIYYNDHGAPGLLCVPSNNGPEIYADQIEKTLQKMKNEKKFRRIFFVIEACYSGSVAKNFSIDGVFAIAAAGPTQSSYSSDWDSQLETFRTNEFTKNFVRFVLEHPDSKIIDSLNDASYNTVRSHVSAYGDFKITSLPLSLFLGKAQPIHLEPESNDENDFLESNGEFTKNTFTGFLQRKLQHSKGEERLYLLQKLQNETNRRKRASQTFKAIANGIDPSGLHDYFGKEIDEIKYNCYRTAVEGFRLFCGEIDEYELPKLRVFAHLCEYTDKDVLLKQIRNVCPEKLWYENDFYL